MLNEIEVGLICLSERKKFKEVYEEYFTALKYFAMRYVKDEEVACDLLQDVLLHSFAIIGSSHSLYLHRQNWLSVRAFSSFTICS